MPNETVLIFGVFDLRQTNATGSEIEEINLHEDWNPNGESYDADIAVLKLKQPVRLSPICLWQNQHTFDRGIVISWTDAEEDDPGYWNHDHDPLHNYPERFDMPIRSNDQCLSKQPRFEAISSNRTFCAGGLNSGQCLEIGNSGASMAVQVETKFYLHGIVSASFVDLAGCDNITFTLFTDVSKFKSWIIETIKGSCLLSNC